MPALTTPRLRLRFALAAAAGAVATAGTRGTCAAQSLLPPGVTPEVHAAIERGGVWLQRSQAGDGSWRSTGSHGSYPVAMTSLAGMALVAAGSTPTRGAHYLPVRRAVDYLRKNADGGTGLIAVPAEDSRSMYAHGFATLFLASVFGMEEDVREQERLKRILDRAVALIQASQGPTGGWNYTPDIGFDEGSITITQVQALRACRMAGIVVDKRTIDRAIDYIKKCQKPDGSIRYRLGQEGAGRPAITAAGVAVLYNAGVYDDQAFVDAAVQFCKRGIRTSGNSHNFYTHQYWSQALYQRGGDDWADYYGRLSAWLLTQQLADGSWNGDNVGPVYGTAVAMTLLLLPYAYVPIYQR
jgi:hypothetical protein